MADTTCDRCGITIKHDTADVPPARSPVTAVVKYCLSCAKYVLGRGLPPKTLMVAVNPTSQVS